MAEGRARDGAKQRFAVDLDVEFVDTGVGHAHRGHRRPPARRTMDDQGWAKEHYEQLYHATGTVQFGESTLPFDGYGWRDHSSGPRGGGTGAPWGGHVIIGCLYPESGRGWGLGRYWGPDGTISLEGGWVVDATASWFTPRSSRRQGCASLTLEPEELVDRAALAGRSLEHNDHDAHLAVVGDGRATRCR